MTKWISRCSAAVVAAVVALQAPLYAFPATTVGGTVKDSQTGEPLPSANVVIVGTSLGAATDLNGNYVIRNVPNGSYTLRASYMGYRSLEVTIDVAEGAALTRDFKLDPVTLEGQEVVVTAQAKGQNAAINTQLASDRIVNVVSSARIQELPDANAAEAVGRLPGVSIVRNGGEGTQVVVRGLEPKYNAITVDGVRMSSSNSSDRSADLSMISPYMLEGIEVTKTVTPDQDADVIGGTVNFTLKEAGAGKEGLGLSLLAQGGYNGLDNAPHRYNNYKYVASAEGRFFEDQLGVFAQADLERRNLASNEFGASYTHEASSTTNYITQSLNLNDVPRDRRRANGVLVVDYRLPEGKLSLSNFFSSGVTDVQNRGESYTIPINVHYYTLAHSKSTLNTITNALNLEEKLPLFMVRARLSHTYSETWNPDDWTVTFSQASAGLDEFINVANINPLDVPKGANDDTSLTYLNGLVTNNSFSRERALTASLDLETELNLTDQVTTVIKFGGKYRHQTRGYLYDQSGGQGLGLLSAVFVDSLIASHFASTSQYTNTTSIPVYPFLDPTFHYGKFLKGDFPMILPLNFAMLSEMARFIKSNSALLASRNDISYFHDNFSSTTNDYAGYENLSAFYVMATANIGSKLTIIGGVRYQDLQTTYSASRGIQNTASASGGSYLHYDTTVTVTHAYWLPDITFRYKLTSWFDLRLSYTNTLAYPDYSAIIPRIDVGGSGGSIAWNNFQLVPSRSHNYDLYGSFYSNEIGLFTLGGFLKQIDNLMYPSTFYVSGAGALPYYPPSLTAAPPRGNYNVSTYINNPFRIDNWGVELDWQTHFWYFPRPLDGLVLNVNYTHVFSKAKYPITIATNPPGSRVPVFVDTTYVDRLLYQPNNIVNLSVGYDYEGFSVRVSLLYQADIFAGTNFWPQLRSSTSAYSRWDLSVKQDLPWFGLQVYADLNNINDVSDVSVIHAPTGVPRSQQSYGLTGDVGLRWKF